LVAMPTTIGCLANNRIELTALRAAAHTARSTGRNSGKKLAEGSSDQHLTCFAGQRYRNSPH
jgi:hypothetical protein